jgi:predicted RNA binding protein YcfA (HicA-like mRNA interferase family)
MKHPSGRSVVVPVHGGRDLHTPTLRNILIAAGLTPDEFRALL